MCDCKSRHEHRSLNAPAIILQLTYCIVTHIDILNIQINLVPMMPVFQNIQFVLLKKANKYKFFFFFHFQVRVLA